MSIFISYAREDKDFADELFQRTNAAGLDPWMDKPPPPFEAQGLLPGERWKERIESEIRRAARVILLCSRISIAKVGFVQNEFRWALHIMNSMPADRRFAIPLSIDDSDPPNLVVGTISISDLNWLRFSDYKMDGTVRLLKADLGL